MQRKVFLGLGPFFVLLVGAAYMVLARPAEVAYQWPLFAVAAVTLALAVYGLQNRQVAGAAFFALFMFGVAEWSFGYAMELGADSVAARLLWSKVEYPGIVLVPVSFLMFAIELTGRGHWLTRRNRLLLSALPALALVLQWTNDWTHWFYVSSQLRTYGPLTVLDVVHGPAFWVYLVYAYLMLAATVVLVGQLAVSSARFHQGLYQGQAITMLVGSLFPWVGNALYLFNLTPVPGLDLTPFGFALSGLIVAWGLFRFKLLDLAPIARDALIESLEDGVIVLDLHNRVTDLNPAARAIIGPAAVNAIGQTADQVLAHLPDLAERLRGQAADRQEIQWGEGEARLYFDLRISPLHDPRGRLTGHLIGLHNITDLTTAQAQMALAKQAAEDANRAKSDFLATMSHEIRTPMNGVVGMTELLLDTPLSLEQREFVETIRVSADNLLTIINDVLDFSKIESGRMELEQQAFDLQECLESATDLVSLRASEKHLELACLVYETVPRTIVSDATRLRQILVNLLSNAVKFTDRGEVRVEVQRLPEPASAAAGCSLMFTVADTGLGIPPEKMSRLFQSFTQLDASTTRKYGGTGLGLAISKRLTEMMGGRLWAESSGVPGEGSAFHFTVAAQAAPASAEAGAQRDTAVAQLAGKHMLIVDDNATNRRILGLQVQRWGMTCELAASGPEALARLDPAARFDLAILDLQMPEMDGDMLSEALVRAAPKLPLVLLSSQWPMLRPSQRFRACLSKPVKPAQLAETLVGIFAPGTAAQPAAPAGPRFDPHLAEQRPLDILLAEDNVVNQQVAQRMLQRMGYRADVVANGQEVLDALHRRLYDVVFLDVQMPEIDGLEAARRICRDWPAARRPRLVAMTALAMQGDREACLAAGMDDYIGKPIRIEELYQALLRCSSRAAPSAAAGDEAPPSAARSAAAPEGAEAAAPDVIQRQALDDLLLALGEGGEADLADFIASYISNAAMLVDTISAALAGRNGPELQRLSHTLKSSSASLGAMRLSDVCREVEGALRLAAQSGAAPDWPALETQVAAIQGEYDLAREALADMSARLRKGPTSQ